MNISKLTTVLAALIFISTSAQAQILEKGRTVKVMPLGDSITQGKDGGRSGYRRVLYEWLHAEGYTITYVGKKSPAHYELPTCSDGSIAWHEGYGSFRTDMILNGGTAERHTAPPLQETLEKFQPDVILLMIGTNDILQDFELDGLEGRTEKILETIYASNPKTTLVLASIAPIKKAQWEEKEARAISYNAALADLVKKQAAAGHRIVFADVYPCLLERHSLNPDGVHPGDIGYARMAQVFYRVLTGTEPPQIDRNNPLLMPPKPPTTDTTK